MTNKEFFVNVMNGEMNEEIMEFAKNKLESMEAAAEKKRNTPSKAAIENEAFAREAILPLMTERTMLASEVGEVVGITTPKATSCLKILVEAGDVEVEEVKTKNGKRKGYFKAGTRFAAE